MPAKSSLFACRLLIGGWVLFAIVFPVAAEEFSPPPANTWQKLTPLSGGPVSPRLGYEGACVWDSKHQLLVRYGGHNQGGGGEQGAEVWTFNPLTAEWDLQEPNTSPPGVCCNAQNLYCPLTERYLRFPKFSGSHGWQWWREIYMNDSSLWTYDLATNRWRNMQPLPQPNLAPYRSASYDTQHGKAVVFGGEGGKAGTVIYDPWRNEWTWPKLDFQPESRSGGTMAYDAENQLHVLFGSQFNNEKQTWAFDLNKNVWRDLQPKSLPPTDKNDAVLTYDPLAKKIVALIKVTSGDGEDAEHELQTWHFDVTANEWTKANPKSEPDPTGNRARNLIFAPELGVALLENCTKQPREQQVWMYRTATVDAEYSPPKLPQVKSPPLVEDVVVSVVATDRVELSWPKPSRQTDDKSALRYQVERAVVEVWTTDQLKRVKQCTPPLANPSVAAIRRIGAFTTITKEPLTETSFIDDQIDLSSPKLVEGDPIYEHSLYDDHLDRDGREYRRAVYVYRVRSVDGDGNVSGPSPATFTIPSSPQHLFSKEDGEACQLKWAANPEQGIAGYRVYRMDGRWSKDTVSRLTEAPISETTFTDKTAGASSRRYYIIAVDAIGQEGFPSAPTWHNREWREFYKPFVGEWHQ